jgi:hypothetical protein
VDAYREVLLAQSYNPYGEGESSYGFAGEMAEYYGLYFEMAIEFVRNKII